MKKLVLAFSFCLGLTTQANAESVQLLQMVGSCTSIEQTDKLLSQYKEISIGSGTSIIRINNDQHASGVGKLYMNLENMTFTFLIDFPEQEKSCILLLGDEFSFTVQGDET